MPPVVLSPVATYRANMGVAPTAKEVNRMTVQAVRPTVWDTAVFEQLESVRKFPVVFTRARGAELFAENGRMFLDFFCGGGALNYGHNHPHLKRRLAEHVRADGLTHGLDVHTAAKREFLTGFQEIVLEPRELRYKVQFCTDPVETALTLAREATGRRDIVRPQGTFERMLAAPPAAVVVEPVRLDGVHPAAPEWLRGLRELTERHGTLLICDESRTGCGRTGPFFGFEHAGVVPDIVILSTSLSGYGLPMSATLFRPDLDVWAPGEHCGNQLAFVTGTAALELWQQTHFHTGRAVAMRRLDLFREKVRLLEPDLVTRGRGMVLGIDLASAGGTARAEQVQRRCFDNGLLVGLCGPEDQVVTVLPPLTIDPARHERGLEILQRALLGSD
jgi:diaminobutyrate-2-oxoglutarate transaminase